MSKSVIMTSLALVLAMTMVLAAGRTWTQEELPAQSVLQAEIPLEAEATILSEASDTASPRETRTGNHPRIMPDVAQGEVILDSSADSGVDTEDALMVSLNNVQQALSYLQSLARETGQAVDRLERQAGI